MLPSFSKENEPLLRSHKTPPTRFYITPEERDPGIHRKMIVFTILIFGIWIAFVGFDEYEHPAPIPESMYIVPPPVYKEYSNERNEDGSLSVVAISDVHDMFRTTELIKIPPADVLIIAGDLTLEDELQADYFQTWLDTIETKHKVIVYGNEDMLPYTASNIKSQYAIKRSVILINEVREVMGYRIFGSPNSQFTGAYPLISTKDAEKHWESVLPPNAEIDIIVTHSPPYGYGDSRNGKSHEGDRALLRAVQNLKTKPMLWICGHVAEGHGVYKVPHPPSGGEITLINGALTPLKDLIKTARPRIVTLPNVTITQPTDAEVLSMLGDRYRSWDFDSELEAF
mmetsp:Transcript_17863/g.32605  ORF Transcript_17863/g.32605 Transcript_17863/m.32605 type:complete len:341 (-) Transcript_17863:673-1695(-)|eukprot:CAMPEP_0175047262 /NCGR_PEP_ID=MMETSP0052_2-20121109/5492_1 /TAXON_ID=51329 ORGANISM="Polytomella parva, Strain SAG 63-3" /NCGR_SAMPLE_ID=MMETSP0052_2 /ASSEMBLY_ACC=CAM_ASM_000194 /LENGTH=340 /DNA_ID=CAMNT_0016311107 /DNA_START=51 /DNA_END=1073 /DNA_ORIENTATION=+